jgi:hypothetical protein
MNSLLYLTKNLSKLAYEHRNSLVVQKYLRFAPMDGLNWVYFADCKRFGFLCSLSFQTMIVTKELLIVLVIKVHVRHARVLEKKINVFYIHTTRVALNTHYYLKVWTSTWWNNHSRFWTHYVSNTHCCQGSECHTLRSCKGPSNLA